MERFKLFFYVQDLHLAPQPRRTHPNFKIDTFLKTPIEKIQEHARPW